MSKNFLKTVKGVFNKEDPHFARTKIIDITKDKMEGEKIKKAAE
jgi:hypothetical protein